jgi:hypothetical protein
MKITRQDTAESYNTTANWLKDFADSLKKDANFIDNFKKIKNKEFGSIEEKMADIRQRVGFDLIKTMKDEPAQVKSASAKCDHVKDESDTEECKVCKAKKVLDEEGLSILKNFVEYAIDFGKSRPDASIEAIIHECKRDPKLKFEKIEKNINPKSLRKMLKTKLSKYRKEKEDKVKYVSDETTSSSMQNDLADYVLHASPKE